MIDLDALAQFDEELGKRSSGVSSYFSQGEIGAETDFRVLPPSPELSPLFFLEEKGYWINGKRYVSPATFGEACVIAEEIEEAKRLNDPDVNKLLNFGKTFNNRSTFLIPGLLLDVQLDNHGVPTNITVKDNAPKILQATTMLVRAMITVARSRFAQNGTKDGMFDAEKGFNFVLSKEVSGNRTEYKATKWPESWSIPSIYLEKVPDIYSITRKRLKSDRYLRSVIRNYLYGEAMLEEESRYGDDTTASAKQPEPIKKGKTRSLASDIEADFD